MTAIKTYTNGTLTTTVRLEKHAIVILEQNGKSCQNEWGGYPTLHVGSDKYLLKKFNAL